MSRDDDTWVDPGVTWAAHGTEDAPVPAAAPVRYEQGVSIGAGGIGQVFRRPDRVLGRDVAYKRLRSVAGGAVPPATVARFVREAQVTAQLEHPNIVPVYDAGEDEQGRAFYTMRLVQGRTLADALADADNLARRLLLLPHFVDVCQGMAYAHSRGVVHRDLKPANIMVGRFGETQIVDWGLAKVEGLDDTEGVQPVGPDASAQMTVVGTVMGTPAYMSPEQAAGAEIDARSDVWSLGAMLYEILAGSAPFAGHTALEIVKRVQEEDVEPVRAREADAPAELVAVAEKALRLSPDERYQSAGELAAEIQAWLNGGLVGAYAYSPSEQLWRWVTQHRGAVIAASIAVVVIAAVGVVSWRSLVVERNQAQASEKRAVASEAEAQEARTRAEESLADALVESALVRLERGELAEAETLAARALTLSTHPGARGIIARAAAGWHPTLLRVHERRCRSLAWTSVGTLVCGSEEGAFEWVDSDWVTLHPAATEDVGTRADGEILLLPQDEGFIRLLRSGSELSETGGNHRVLLRAAENAPVVAWADGSAMHWRGESDGMARLQSPSNDSVSGLAMRGDGKAIAGVSTGGQAQVVVLSTVTGTELMSRTLTDAGGIYDVAYSSDGSMLALATGFSAIRVLDAATGGAQFSLDGHTGVVSDVAWSPDGSLLASV